jgi:hypothetical protein
LFANHGEKIFHSLRLSLLTPALLLLSACVTPIPIDNVAFPGETTVKSSKEARVTISSSNVGGSSGTRIVPVAGTFVAAPTRSASLPFNEKDQQEFLKSLRTELVRLGIVRATTVDPSAAVELAINVHIARATFSVDAVEYTLDVVLNMSGGERPVQKQYHIVSTEKDSIWEKWNTNGAEARLKTAKLLLEKLVPDIETYVGSMHPGNGAAQ